MAIFLCRFDFSMCLEENVPVEFVSGLLLSNRHTVSLKDHFFKAGRFLYITKQVTGCLWFHTSSCSTECQKKMGSDRAPQRQVSLPTTGADNMVIALDYSQWTPCQVLRVMTGMTQLNMWMLWVMAGSPEEHEKGVHSMCDCTSIFLH